MSHAARTKWQLAFEPGIRRARLDHHDAAVGAAHGDGELVKVIDAVRPLARYS
jgi:hypothetical protein